MTERVIAYTPTVDWPVMRQRPQQLLSALAKYCGWKVLFPNLHRIPGFEKPTEVEPGVIVFPDMEIMMRHIKGMGKPVDVTYSTWAKMHEWHDKINALVDVYDCVDHFPDWQPYEQAMRARADVIFAVSAPLMSELALQGWFPIYLPNACSSDILDKIACVEGGANSPRPAEMPMKPTMLFIGYVGAWVDTEILEAVAEAYPLVIVGPKTSAQNRLRKAIWVGEKSYADTIPYYEHASLGVLAFDNSVTARSASPIKLYEFAGASIPTVCTPIPEAWQFAAAGAAIIAETPEETVEAIRLSDGVQTMRLQAREFAIANTWEHRAHKFVEEVEKWLPRGR